MGRFNLAMRLLRLPAPFYGAAQDNGGPASDPNILSNGDLVWSGSFPQSQTLNSSGVAVDQQGLGTLYQYWMPGSGGDFTNFFQVNGTGRTFGLLQQSNGLPTPDPQWILPGIANFAVNPVYSNEIVISSQTGNLFSTSNGGVTWFDIGQPSVFNNPPNYSIAMAYGPRTLVPRKASATWGISSTWARRRARST